MLQLRSPPAATKTQCNQINKYFLKKGTYLEVQWIRLRAPNAVGPGSVPGQGTKVPYATWHGQKKKGIELKINKYMLKKKRKNSCQLSPYMGLSD